jgi:hypothetical protein
MQYYLQLSGIWRAAVLAARLINSAFITVSLQKWASFNFKSSEFYLDAKLSRENMTGMDLGLGLAYTLIGR